MENTIVNRVASSPIVTLDLSEYKIEGERVMYDLKDNLFQGLVLREKDFRTFLKEHGWSVYAGKHVAIHCSADAIIPSWAQMLLTTYLAPHAETVVYGSFNDLEKQIIQKMLANINVEALTNRPVVVKGCGDIPFPEYIYVQLTQMLLPVVKSLMFGEPCSTVPIYKKKTAK